MKNLNSRSEKNLPLDDGVRLSMRIRMLAVFPSCLKTKCIERRVMIHIP